MASAPIYCTHKELKRVFPQLDEYDQKTPVYGWSQSINYVDISDTTLQLHFAYDTGLVDTLYLDGAEINKISFPTTKVTELASAINPNEITFTLDSVSNVAVNDIIKIDNEYIRLTAVSSDGSNTVTTSTANRGLFNTASQHHVVNSHIFKIIDNDDDVGQGTSAGLDALGFVYDDELDLCILIAKDTDPKDFLMEAGEDFKSMVTQFRTDASRYLDSRLDPKLPKNQWKDKNGNFDYMIIRTTALYAAAFMVKTKDPTSELATALMTEADNNVQLLNEGRAALSWQNTGDASKGVLRDVTYTDGSVRPVDFRGRAGGVDYDLVQIKISSTTAGAIGTAKYNVFVKDSTGLKTNQIVTEELITGDYQPMAYGLQVRFAGTTDASVATANNEWEVEVRGYNEEVDTGDLKGIKMTRRRHYL